ncbi:hypothetical protein LTR62_000555 [Meristemomyces frigidus]|uniref:SAP domain-containing protein n=1 Tax=Meristemomyces frigidus TaxID=1508187 RepID=A0AAN7YCC2_9PEZI|nr:hypothetical protein LTR62_000555 [Meristemomyces frigidus]
MATKTLTALKVAQLKHATFLLGLPSAGTKSELITSLTRHIGLHVGAEPAESNRILSVDMGIRNLAYCVVTTTPPSNNENQHSGTEDQPPTALHVSTWSKTDLLQPDPINDTDPETKNKTSSRTALTNDPFTPSHLSRTAYTITRKFLSHSPSTILIERQRFRSGSGAAIQEWTVRVNMLESMLWACLRTLGQQRSTDRDSSDQPELHEVNPARVANFWVPAKDVPLRRTAALFQDDAGEKAETLMEVVGKKTRKIQKKDKINIVRSWLEGSEDVALTFEGEAAITARRFNGEKSTRTTTSTQDAAGIGKLDDLADCLLQAAAWARWQENRRIFAQLVEERSAG